MNNSLIEDIKQSLESSNVDDYSVISVRATKKVATMIEAMGIILQKPVSSVLTSHISEELANYLLEDRRNIELLASVLEVTKSIENTYLQHLEKKGIIGEPPIEFGFKTNLPSL